MTIVGMSTHSRDFLIIAVDGVRPPISRAETSSIRSAPAFQMVEESNGEVEITSNIGMDQQLELLCQQTNIQSKEFNNLALLKTQNQTVITSLPNNWKYLTQNTQMLPFEHNASIRHYGRIHPIRWGYYSNPQMCMFMFTLLLTVTLSLVMISFVFVGFYHKVIGSLLCIYVVFRFLSLGLSSPGLAIEAIDERVWNGVNANNQRRIQTIDIEVQLDEGQPQSPQQQQLTRNNPFPSQSSLKQMGFYSFCNQCKVPIQHRTKHCKSCQTCIDGYDHHCIWIGKCIGKKNLWQFKEFLCFVFLTLIYALILSIQSSKIQRIA